MNLKGYGSIPMMFLMVVSLLSGLVLLSGTAAGVDPVFVSWNIDPVEPTFSDVINLTVTFENNDETITMVQVRICHNDLCDPPVDMTDTGDGETFFHNIPSGGFGETDDQVYSYFHLDVTHSDGSFSYPEETSEELNFTIVREATEIMAAATPDRTTVFPGEIITVSGKVTDDLDENVSGAGVNLSVEGENIFNTTTTGPDGLFQVGVSLPSDGQYMLNLTVEKEGMTAYDEWTVMVNSWPLPLMKLQAGLVFESDARPPGETGNRFYTGSELDLEFTIMNTGTGEAHNVTAVADISYEEGPRTVDIGNMTPSPTFRYEDTLQLNTSQARTFFVNITLDWDQTAPDELKLAYDPVELEITIIEPPTWENHTVLVEMFTQTTCVPCVEVEEAVERLYYETDLDFELMIYVFEDQASQLKATEMGVTSTPDLFIDQDFDRLTGGGTVEEMKDTIAEMVRSASARETPPLDIDFTRSTEDLTVSLALLPIYTEQIDGIFQIYSIEQHSNLRNQQGIPISHRYHGAVDGADISSMIPGSTRNLTLALPEHGMGYVAVMYSPEGEVLQSGSYLPWDDRELYMRTSSQLIRVESPAEEQLVLALERFQFDGASFEGIPYEVSVRDLPVNWTMSMENEGITSQPRTFVFTESGSEEEVLPSTRVRYTDDITLDLSIPEGADGTFSFKVDISSGGNVYTESVVAVVDGEEDPGQNETAEITDIYLEGVGQKLYIYVEAENVAETAKVRARVLPCDYGENANCGIPTIFILIEQPDGRFRAPITGVDLMTYTHLTYNGWIELNGVRIVESEEKQDRIEDLVDLPDPSEEEEETDESLAVFLALLVLLFGLILAAIFFIVLKRKEAEREEEEAQLRSVEDEDLEEEGEMEELEEMGPDTMEEDEEAPLDEDEELSEDNVAFLEDPPDPPEGPEDLYE